MSTFEVIENVISEFDKITAILKKNEFAILPNSGNGPRLLIDITPLISEVFEKDTSRFRLLTTSVALEVGYLQYFKVSLFNANRAQEYAFADLLNVFDIDINDYPNLSRCRFITTTDNLLTISGSTWKKEI